MPNQVPYLHFMQKVLSDDAIGLVSPSEIKEPTSCGGCVVAPVHGNGRFYPMYHFDFAFYVGKGRRREATTGVAYRAVREHMQLLVAVFRDYHQLWSEVRPFYSPPELFVEMAQGSPTAVFKKAHAPAMPSSFKYAGKLGHRDFRHKFSELETVEQRALDALLEDWKIVFIGCDPFEKYERPEK
jgi:hypothetical protein